MYLWAREKGGYSSKKARQTAEQMTHESVRSIAIMRHGAIGDLVILRPLLLELREIFPNASLTLSLVDHYQYGAPIDLVDNVHIVYKKIEGKKTSFFERIKQMKALGEHDIIMDMADDALSMWTMILNKAKLKMGFPYREYRKLFLDIVLERSDFLLETENLLHFANVFGARSKHPFNMPPSCKRYNKPISVISKCFNATYVGKIIYRVSTKNVENFKMTHIYGWC
jgi:ADP-heptose:LPS heptosyltransferase